MSYRPEDDAPIRLSEALLLIGSLIAIPAVLIIGFRAIA
jgi:hypothetical protein